jgi:predicted dinucleotide-binding enzyme
MIVEVSTHDKGGVVMATVSIIGSGNMARAIATRALAGGHDVQIVGRNKDKVAALAADLSGDGKVSEATLGDPLTGDIVVLALGYGPTLEVAQRYGDQLAGKVVVDIANPIDPQTFDKLVTPPDSSAAEELAKVVPAGARVVKAFNTTFGGPLIAGDVKGQQLDVFIAADDDDAKQAVTQLVESVGLRPIDVGQLAMARYLEAMHLAHVRTQFTRGTQFSTALKLID